MNVSVFLGIACAVTCASADVVGGNTQLGKLYFPAAVSQSTSAVSLASLHACNRPAITLYISRYVPSCGCG